VRAVSHVKVLIVGGYGIFGGRLAELLLNEGRLEIFIAGRNLAAAQEFCSAHLGKARLVAVQLDRLNCGEALRKLKPDLVVDASGPFQAYGDDPYKLVRDCFAAGTSYIDLADGADFVAGISTLDESAKKIGHFALSGMSSFPVLTAAVVRKLAVGLDSVDEIVAGIAPSPHSGVGVNVIRAIASYAGQPVKILQDGKWGVGTGFFDSRYLVVHVPDERPLPRIRFALTDVPDLKVLSWDWPEVKSIWMGAGPTPALLHRLLWIAAGLVKLGVLRSLVPLAPLMNWVVNMARWGQHRGGMIVEITGSRGSAKITRSWHLLAEGDGGPYIPSMAAEAIVRRCLDGKIPPIGARSGHRDLELEDYAPSLARYAIKTGIREN
jgi:Saccharopine dehydrogenase NADP binding domain